MTLSKLQFLDDNFYLVIVTKKWNDDKKILKASKKDCNFNRYGCSLYRNKARLSLSQIFVTVTKSFIFGCRYIRFTELHTIQEVGCQWKQVFFFISVVFLSDNITPCTLHYLFCTVQGDTLTETTNTQDDIKRGPKYDKIFVSNRCKFDITCGNKEQRPSVRVQLLRCPATGRRKRRQNKRFYLSSWRSRTR